MLAVLFLNRMGLRRRAAVKKKVVKQVKMQKGPVEDFCRTCLATGDLKAIFASKDVEAERTEELRLVTGLKIKMNDGLPQKICSGCLSSVNVALRLRRTSLKADRALTAMAAKRSIKRNYTVSKIEKVETDDYPFECQLYDDGFQNNDYEYAETEEPKPKIRQKSSRSLIPNSSSYQCPSCGKLFRMKATYKAHLRFHTNYCVCEACGKRCRNNNQLQEHKRARHGLGKIHKCVYCEYSSATKEALTIHERRHTGERPYCCDHCGATFHRRSNLVQHIAIHLPEKNFQCDMCPKRLKSRKFLQIHKHNAHTGRKYGYLCAICCHRFEKPNKNFDYRNTFDGGPRETAINKCGMCPKREKSRKLLAIHEYKYHRENKYRYVCPVCQDSFTRPGNVRQHLVRRHGVQRQAQAAIARYKAEPMSATVAADKPIEAESVAQTVNILIPYYPPTNDQQISS